MSDRSGPLWRAAFFGFSAAAIAWASTTVPLPLIEYVPGEPTPIAPLVEIDGVEVTEPTGEASLLTVLLREQAAVPVIAALLDADRQLLPTGRVYPPGMDRRGYLDEERERFGRQFEVAAVVGARAAGIEAEMVTEVVVGEVMPASPADGILLPGDVLLAVDGRPVVAAEEILEAVRGAGEGSELRLSVQRDDDHLDVEVAPARFPGSDGEVLIGVRIETAVHEVRLPFEVRLAEGTRIGGPSAGLMVGITVYDLLSDEDLLAGRTVMGTGTLDANGTVGRVGGVPEKMRAAAEHGADVVLVPADQLHIARQAAGNLALIGVSSLDEALEALRDTA